MAEPRTDTPEQIADALRALESVGITTQSLAAGTRLACTRLAQFGDAEPTTPAQGSELRDAEAGAAAWRERYIAVRKRCSAIETERDELLVALEVLRGRTKE